ncbi:hypothetical protein [Corynebacterium lubricantis]|uniref:hypothetical protein n=1 Tax=Corynebacterium lubricantis TaxID=541095 RepID=UPI00037BDB0D|nr:hypothetical protein [Corynebacterium lubricantis]
MHNQRHNRAFNPILLTGEIDTLQDLYTGIADVVYSTERPAPTNLDGLADMLRESHVRKVITSHWSLDDDDSRKVGQVFKDLGVHLVR